MNVNSGVGHAVEIISGALTRKNRRLLASMGQPCLWQVFDHELTPGIRRLRLLWLCHSDARQVSDFPERSHLLFRSMTAPGRRPAHKEGQLTTSRRLAAHRSGKAIAQIAVATERPKSEWQARTLALQSTNARIKFTCERSIVVTRTYSPEP